MILVLQHLSKEAKNITQDEVSASEWQFPSGNFAAEKVEYLCYQFLEVPPARPKVRFFASFRPLYTISKVFNLSAVRTRKVGEVV